MPGHLSTGSTGSHSGQPTVTVSSNGTDFADWPAALDAAVLAASEQLAKSLSPDLVRDFVAPLIAAVTEAEAEGARAFAVEAKSAAEALSFSLWWLLNQEASAWRDAAAHGWVPAGPESMLGLCPFVRAARPEGPVGADAAGCPIHADGYGPLVAGGHIGTGEPLSHMLLGRAIPALARRFKRLTLHKEQVCFSQDGRQVPVALPCDVQALSVKANDKHWQVKDHAIARTIVTDDMRFGPPNMAPYLEDLSARTGLDFSVALRIANNAMFFMSGPRHAVARRLVTGCLGGNRLRSWESMVVESVALALDRLGSSAEPDLVTDFSEPLFRMAARRIMGINPSDPGRFDALAPDFQDILKPVLPLKDLLRVQRVMETLLGEIEGQRSQVGAEDPPTVLTSLLDAQLEAFDPLDCRALVLILYGASFNLSHTLANMLYWILSLPAEEREGVADDGWIAGRLERMLPLVASPKYIYRMARESTEVEGLAFAEGDTAQVQLSQVNHGVAAGHLAFGHGLHHCVGAALSRLLLKCAVPALFRRYPDLALVPNGHLYFDYSQTVALRSLKCSLL